VIHIPIPIPIGTKYYAVLRESSWKVVTCEYCQETYAFVLDIEAQGSDTDLLFLDSSGAEQRAIAQARENLSAKTQNSIATVPCPQCGFYQADMVRQMKEDAWVNPTQIAGAIVILLALIPLTLGIAYVWVVTAVVATAGAALLGYGYVLSSRYDPNAGDATVRKESAQKHAVWGDQLAQMLKEKARPTE
jgi:hypothetical protein